MADLSDSQSEDGHSVDHPVFGDWGASAYNDGDGISCKVGFQPLSNPNVKKRKGGKPVTISKALGLHEDWAFADFLVWVVAKTLQRDDLLAYSSLYQKRPVPHDSFTVSYTIPHTHLQDVMLESEHDYLTMMKAAKAKAKPKASITVIEVWRPEPDGDEDGDQDADENESEDRQKKKTKTHHPSPEEELQDQHIQILQDKYTCEDRLCKSSHCFIAGPNAEHLKLTFSHFRSWSAAIEGEVRGVDYDTPPNARLFDAAHQQDTNDNVTDISLLSARRLDQVKRNASAMPSAAAPTQVVMSFDGLADVLAILQPEKSQPVLAPSTAPNVLSKLPPKLSLDRFCRMYEISDATFEKLRAMEVDGPHLLRIITDADLKVEGKIPTSQVAAIRDAEQRWLADVKEFDI